MKVELIIDENLDESLVKIYAPSYNEDIENIKRSLETTNIDKLVVFKDDEIYLLEYEEIIRCVTKDKNVFIESKNGKYKSRIRLYELYERLNKNKFIKISRYEIINLDYVKKLDLSFKGTIEEIMKDLKNLLKSFLIGVGIGSIIEIFISLAIGEITLGVPEFLNGQDSLLKARIIEIILYGGFGIVAFIGSKIIKEDHLLKASLTHFTILAIYFIIVGFYLKWLPNIQSAISSLIFFVIIYLIIWALIYFSTKSEIEKLNKKFK